MAKYEKSERAEKAEKAEKQAIAAKLHPVPQAHIVHDAARDSALADLAARLDDETASVSSSLVSSR